MKRTVTIVVSVLAGIFLILYAAYLFIVPNLIDLNSYKPEIIKTVKADTGLDLSIDELDFKTNPDFSVTVSAKKLIVSHEDGNRLLSVDSVSLKVALLPLILKKIEIKETEIDNIAANFYRLKNGKYKISEVLNKLEPSGEKPEFEISGAKNIEINTYKAKLEDYSRKTTREFLLAGDLLKIFEFKPEKFVKLETKGTLFVENNPNVTFDIKLNSELPSAKKENKEKSEAPDKKKKAVKQSLPGFDPLDAILKYDFKNNLVVDLSLKNIDKTPNIKGFAEFNGFSLKLKGKTLPESYGKLIFKGKSFDITSKLYITPVSYVSVEGNIRDIARNKLNLAVKTTDIDLKDLKYFIDALNELSGVKNKALESSNLSGKLKADFKIANHSGKPDFSGYMNISDINIKLEGISKPLKNINGKIKFSGNKLIFTDTYGYIDKNKAVLSGSIDSDNFVNLKLILNPFNIKTVFDLINESSMLQEIKPQFEEISSMSGNLKIESHIKGNLNRKIFPETQITIINPSVVPKQTGFPISLSKGIIDIKETKILLNGLQANILNSPVLISGNISEYSSENPKPDITINIPEFNMSRIKYLTDLQQMNPETKKLLNDIKNPTGSFSASIKILPDQKIEASANINNIFLYYEPADLPVNISSGMLNSDGNLLNINNIRIKLSNTPVSIFGTVKNLGKLPEIDLTAKGYISAADIKKYSPPELRKSVNAKGNLPLNAKMSGTAEDWNINVQVLTDNISYLADITNPGNKLLNISLRGDSENVNIDKTGLYSLSGATGDRIYNLNSAKKLIFLSGEINKYNGKNPVLNKVKAGFSKLNLALVEPKGTLRIDGSLSFAGNTSAPKAYGTVKIGNISVPSMSLYSDSVDLSMKNNGIFINTRSLRVIDSVFKINAQLKNDLSQPFIVENITVSSSYMNADKLQKAFPPVPNQDLPVIVNKGKFVAAQILSGGLKLTNTSADFVINPMNVMKITDLISHIAGGTATGKVNMNLKTSRIFADIKLNNAEINELASAFGVPGEIYGNLNGRIDVTTVGYTPEENSNNAYGKIIFTVTDGKLNKLGSLSYLLKARNLLSTGFASQIVDTFIQLKEAKAGNQFKKLTGDISLNYGTANINEITSQGGDMSLYVKGYTHLSNNYSDITILGTMSDRLASKLGKLTEITVDGLIEKLPGQWGQIIGSLRQKPTYPDVDRIPPLTGGSQESDRHFVVRIQGDARNPTSIKSFKFID